MAEPETVIYFYDARACYRGPALIFENLCSKKESEAVRDNKECQHLAIVIKQFVWVYRDQLLLGFIRKFSLQPELEPECFFLGGGGVGPEPQNRIAQRQQFGAVTLS